MSFNNRTMQQSNNASGFTLIEMLIVVGITAILTSIMLTYSSGSRNQIRLYTEEAKIAETVIRAKSLTVATYNDPQVPCGYGVFFDYEATPQQYKVFKYDPGAEESCAGIDRSNFNDSDPGWSVIQQGEGVVNIVPREVILRGDESDSLEYVFFEPPNPTTSIWHKDEIASSTQGKLYLQTIDGQAELEVFVNDAGQISF